MTDSISKIVGISQPDKDGTLWVEAKRVGDQVHLICQGHAFVVCKVVSGRSVVEVVDVDTGVRFTDDITVLCWSR